MSTLCCFYLQVWTEFNSTEIGKLAREGFQIIFSNYDVLYLDCGFQSWVGDGHNWCSPYKTWQGIHDNDPRTLLADLVGDDLKPEEIQKLALGAEAALWSEQADPMNLDSRIWPRAAALAER
jgi:hexosaminidase